MLKTCSAAVLILGVLLVIGCAAHVHKVGNGAQSNDMIVARQWYVLYGLMPVNKVDTSTMAGAATDYEIITQYTGLDVIFNIVAGVTSVNSRTVIVRK